MRLRAGCLFGFPVAVLLLAVPASAQIGQGRLTGIATDTQGAVMPGVTVTATSPALIGTRTTVTEPDGSFLLVSLPSGVYKLTFDLQGFRQFVRDNVQVVLGQTITVDAQMQIGGLAENVVVTGASPVVDVATTQIGTNLRGEELVGVPNSTDVWGALSEAPGVRMLGFDVGGSHKSQQSGYEVFGVQNQARTVTDGIDHTEGVGGTGFYEDYFANNEVSVSALGADVEMNSPGAAIVTTIKSGGNTFKGLEHLTYEPGSFVGTNGAPSDVAPRGYTCPPNASGEPQCANPNLLFWEGHLDLGGPIMRDKAWFYGAYNHFKIDKVVSGVAESVATDLGIFDNYTGKGTFKANQANTFIGYYQRGRKQKPKRGLSTLRPPESVQAQDSVSAMYKGEWQFVASNRAFFYVNVGNFTLDWPMVPQVDPKSKPPELDRSTTAVRGAGWNSFTTGRKKPQVKAQLTYYLPEKAGSHDFKFGFEDLYDSYRFGINGSNGPIRYSYPSFASGQADRIRFADTGPAGDFSTGWTVSPIIDQHYSGFLQDRWAASSRVSITAGVRIDYQKIHYTDSVRRPEVHDRLADGTSIFPAESTVASGTLVTNTDLSPRVGVSYSLSSTGRTVLKAFWGRYYNNLADGFSSANPGGTNYAEYNFLDQNRNNRYDGPSELGSLRLRIGGATYSVNPDLKTPHTDEVSGSVEHQFWGESSARITDVRKNQYDYVPFYFTPFIAAWMGRVTAPVRVVNSSESGTETFNLLDVPASIADQTDGTFDNWPDGNFHYDTIEFAFNKRFSDRFFVQSSFDHIWRNELRSADITNWGSTSPLSADPIGVGPQFTLNPSAPNRQKTTMYHAQFLGRYTFPRDVAVAVNYRFQSGFPFARIVDESVTGEPTLNVCNVECTFFVENLDRNRSEAVNLLNFRLDKAFPIGKVKFTAMLDIYNLLNVDPVTNFNLFSDDFKRVIAVLDPRVFQAGFRLEF
jgi:Carboxypeptidase regulatory-like domain